MGARQKILDAVRADGASIVDFTRELVAIASENPPGAFYKRCVDVVSRKLAEIGLDHDVVEVPEVAPDIAGTRHPRFAVLARLGAGENMRTN